MDLLALFLLVLGKRVALLLPIHRRPVKPVGFVTCCGKGMLCRKFKMEKENQKPPANIPSNLRTSGSSSSPKTISTAGSKPPSPRNAPLSAVCRAYAAVVSNDTKDGGAVAVAASFGGWFVVVVVVVVW